MRSITFLWTIPLPLEEIKGGGLSRPGKKIIRIPEPNFRQNNARISNYYRICSPVKMGTRQNRWAHGEVYSMESIAHFFPLINCAWKTILSHIRQHYLRATIFRTVVSSNLPEREKHNAERQLERIEVLKPHHSEGDSRLMEIYFVQNKSKKPMLGSSQTTYRECFISECLSKRRWNQQWCLAWLEWLLWGMKRMFLLYKFHQPTQPALHLMITAFPLQTMKCSIKAS